MNALTLVLKVTDFTFDLEYIERLTGIKPSKAVSKGMTYIVGPMHRQQERKYDTNYWEYRIHIANNTVWIKTIVDEFVTEILASKIQCWEKIKDDCMMELYIGVHYKDKLDSFHFDRETISLFSRINLEIDIDQYGEMLG
jgi:hypothetical protein